VIRRLTQSSVATSKRSLPDRVSGWNVSCALHSRSSTTRDDTVPANALKTFGYQTVLADVSVANKRRSLHDRKCARIRLADDQPCARSSLERRATGSVVRLVCSGLNAVPATRSAASAAVDVSPAAAAAADSAAARARAASAATGHSPDRVCRVAATPAIATTDAADVDRLHRRAIRSAVFSQPTGPGDVNAQARREKGECR
jgi:hypothetical protein